MNNKEHEENLNIINKIEFLKGLTNQQKKMLAKNINSLKFKKNENIVNKGDQADSYFLIKKGKVGCYDEDKFI